MASPGGIPFGLKVPVAGYPPSMVQNNNNGGTGATPNMANIPEIQRAQMMEFSHRLRAFGLPYAAPHGQVPNRLLQVDPLFYLYGRQDPRMGFFHEEPKPSQSYIGLIAMGILKSKDRKMVLSDIYQHILDSYPYFRTRGPGWRNSIRHNLSLNDCFIKSGRAANGKGHYWAVHPAVEGDFEKGDFRRRRAQRKVRKAMGLAVPDEDDSPSPSPPPCAANIADWRVRYDESRSEGGQTSPVTLSSSTLSPENSPDVHGIPKSINHQLPPTHRLGENHPAPFLPWVNLSPVQWKQMQQSLLMPIAPAFRDMHGHFTSPPHLLNHHHYLNSDSNGNKNCETVSSPPGGASPPLPPSSKSCVAREIPKVKRRAFDVESLLAPDSKELREGLEETSHSPSTSYENSKNTIYINQIKQENSNTNIAVAKVETNGNCSKMLAVEDEGSDIEVDDLEDGENARPITSTPKSN